MAMETPLAAESPTDGSAPGAVAADLVFGCPETAAFAAPDTPTDLSDRTNAVTELFPAARYRRPAPVLVRSRNPEFVRRLAAAFADIDADPAPLPPTLLCESRDIRFGYGVLYYPSGDRPAVLQETFRANDRAVLRGPDAGFRRVDATWDADSVLLLVASAGSFNYGHWLVDDLPRLEAFRVLERRHPGVPITILLASYDVLIDEVRRRSILAYLPGRRNLRIRFLQPAENHRFARLYHVTPSSRHPQAKSPESLRAMVRRMRCNTWTRRAKARLRHLWQAPGPALRRGGRRLFVDRSPARGRTLANRAAIVARLEALGFETVDPERMNLREQMVLFSQADLVVGIMGAAMTNTIFCPPGAELIYLAAGETWIEPFYWDLAAIGGHRYAVVFGEPEEPKDGRQLPSFAVDVEDLDAALRVTRAYDRKGGDGSVS